MATNFNAMRAEDILKPEALAEHRDAMLHFHLALTGVHTDLFFVQKLVDFPLTLFAPFESGFFLVRVVHNFMQAAVLGITRMATDSGGDCRTLRQFKNFMAHAVKNEFSDEYRQQIKRAQFDDRTTELLAKAKTIRDTQIAHTVVSRAEVTRQDVLTLGELKTLRDELTKLFEVASFETEYRYLLMSYDPTVQHPAGTDSRSDIDKILDAIARDSGVLALPEEEPEAWPIRRRHWAGRMLDDFNRYRQRLGLPEA